MNKTTIQPKSGKPVQRPAPEALAKISTYDTLHEKALAITRRYKATEKWGRHELRVIFTWMYVPCSIDDRTTGDADTLEIIIGSQMAFARLFAEGPDVLKPLGKLLTIYRRATRSQVTRAAMSYGMHNDILRIWNRARAKSHQKLEPNKHEDKIWGDKALALGTKDISPRAIESLRAHLRRLARK